MREPWLGVQATAPYSLYPSWTRYDTFSGRLWSALVAVGWEVIALGFRLVRTS